MLMVIDYFIIYHLHFIFFLSVLSLEEIKCFLWFTSNEENQNNKVLFLTFHQMIVSQINESYSVEILCLIIVAFENFASALNVIFLGLKIWSSIA